MAMEVNEPANSLHKTGPFYYSPVFSCLFFPKSCKSASVLAFGPPRKYSIVTPVQPLNAVPLHSIMCPTVLGSDPPSVQDMFFCHNDGFHIWTWAEAFLGQPLEGSAWVFLSTKSKIHVPACRSASLWSSGLVGRWACSELIAFVVDLGNRILFALPHSPLSLSAPLLGCR